MEEEGVVTGIEMPDGIKDVDNLVKDHKELLSERDEIVFETSLIRLAIPESKSQADEDQSQLEEFDPPERMDLKDIPRTIVGEDGKKKLNVVWVREYVRTYKEGQIAHTAKAVPFDALNHGTEVMTDTAQKVFTMRCTARKKSRFCKEYGLPSQLMICSDATGTEEKCINCYNDDNKTGYTHIRGRLQTEAVQPFQQDREAKDSERPEKGSCGLL